MEEKQALRQRILSEIRRTPGPDPQKVADTLCALKEYREAGFILGYVPLKSEVDISVFLDKAAAEGKTIAFPALNPGDIATATADWRNHLIKLPNNTYTTDSSPVLKINGLRSRMAPVGITKGLILVPGLAFTEFGTRLGRGAGYYDQLLDLMTNSGSLDFISIGICRQSQLLDNLPQQPHDRKVRMVITF
ncbi:MAG: 5-formyltetrahydrofolate cyclo-ligase [bacterium]|nr:5-formyltetrahydrofolate cyclo-ligase [bacterium]